MEVPGHWRHLGCLTLYRTVRHVGLLPAYVGPLLGMWNCTAPWEPQAELPGEADHFLGRPTTLPSMSEYWDVGNTPLNVGNTPLNVGNTPLNVGIRGCWYIIICSPAFRSTGMSNNTPLNVGIRGLSEYNYILPSISEYSDVEQYSSVCWNTGMSIYNYILPSILEYCEGWLISTKNT